MDFIVKWTFYLQAYLKIRQHSCSLNSPTVHAVVPSIWFHNILLYFLQFVCRIITKDLYVTCAALVLLWSVSSDVTDCDLKVTCVCLYNDIKCKSNNKV